MNAVSPGTIFRRLLALLLPLVLACAAPAIAADWDLDRLMQSLAKTKEGRATFVEKKYLALLDRPVESSGELLYVAPDRLEKRTVKPKPESMLVEGDTLSIERGRQKHSVQMQEYPELAGFIDSIRGTLAGDRKALERSFRLKLEGQAERWTLNLWPTNAKLATNIHLVQITGSRDNVRSIEIIQTDGDRSVMTIEKVASR
ncbi:outer membrane lipoprotein carrier protein LolA [Noviherbaspirillum cavernae]|uniref:Outer membrane lipoprotein carrier protein LolA n=1 Tax=Noviherbaspirillum cavernae TaxID=2320862 RepID=A0A418X5D9_9BURK|nr:LolA-related protein [Noviherbaspirillum cavernae]RJG07704.1 outer membrane lipoprotein carrier protein LolA [Noviherbaspirillum cavernae]